jgi:cation diffusion facilitator CzcD-associated flavoprotein CzcO
VIMPSTHTYATLIIGAGFTGLGAAIKLAEAGGDDDGAKDIVILERTDQVGGTWRDTTYPGASCDIPSLLYSFSFVKNPTWSRTYSPAEEICKHFEDMAAQFDIRRHIRFGQEVNGLAFDERAGVWTATTHAGKHFRARTVVLASGPLPDFSFPDIRGINSYRGHKIHSADWDHDYDFANKRVAVIGTGASAIQIIPELVKQAEFVKVFQRTPSWVLPRWDIATPPPYRQYSPKFQRLNSLRAKPCSGDMRPAPPHWCGTLR